MYNILTTVKAYPLSSPMPDSLITVSVFSKVAAAVKLGCGSSNAGFLCPCAGDVYDDASLIGLDHSPDGDTRHLERVLEVYS